MLKIAITGPESTGKSELCNALAEHYKTVYVPEFARTFLEGRRPPYEIQDLISIAKAQFNPAIDTEKNTHEIIFYDTEMTVMKIWCGHAFGFCHSEIEELYNKQHFDLYLLMDIDLVWQPDPLREHPDLREYFFMLYKKELETNKRNYKVISGIGNLRTQNAINAIEDFRNGI